MIWRAINNIARASAALHQTVAAIGAAAIIMLGVYDIFKSRGEKRRD